MNLGDKSDVKKNDKAARVRELNKIADLKFLLNYPQFRRYLFRYLSESGTTESVYKENPYVMYFLEGNRNVGLKMLSEVMEANPESYAQMIKENKVQEQEEPAEGSTKDEEGKDDPNKT